MCICLSTRVTTKSKAAPEVEEERESYIEKKEKVDSAPVRSRYFQLVHLFVC